MNKRFEWQWEDPNGDIHVFKTNSLEKLIENISSETSCIFDWYGDKKA